MDGGQAACPTAALLSQVAETSGNAPGARRSWAR